MAKFNGATGDFGDVVGSGYTGGVQAEFALVAFSIYGDAGWTYFSGEDDNDNVNGFELAAGGRLLLGPIFIGGQYGYATGDLDQNLWRPEVGVRLGPVTAFGQYQLNRNKWWSLGGSFSFF